MNPFSALADRTHTYTHAPVLDVLSSIDVFFFNSFKDPIRAVRRGRILL